MAYFEHCIVQTRLTLEFPAAGNNSIRKYESIQEYAGHTSTKGEAHFGRSTVNRENQDIDGWK
jgi:hypothetical protein